MNIRTWQRRGFLATVGLLAFVVLGGALFASFQWTNQLFPGFFLYSNLNVAPYFLPHWTGEKEGLRFLDRVLTVQDMPVSDRHALYELVRSRPPGTSFQYTFEREGKLFHASIASMRLTFRDWLLSFGSYIVTGLGFLVIGLTPFCLRPALPAARVLFFMVSIIFFWFLSTFDFLTGGILPKEVRIFAITLTPSAGIHLALLLTGSESRRKRHLVRIFLIYSASVGLGLFYSVSYYGSSELWQLALRLSYGYTCLGAIVFLFLLWNGLKRSGSSLERSRLRVVWVGAIVGFFIPTLGTVLTSFFYWKLPYNLLLVPTVFFPLSVAYALLKYSLFDLDAVLKVGLTRAALTGVLLLIYVLIVSVLGVFVGIYDQDPLVPLFFSVLVVLVFNPLLRWIERAVDHYLYRREYDPLKLQNEVSLLLRSLARPQAVAERYLRSVADHAGIEQAAMFFQPKGEKRYLGVFLNGNGDGHRFQEILESLGSFWIHHLGIEKRGISKEEIRFDPLYRENRDLLMSDLGTLDSELLIPIIFEANVLGFVSFGRKRSGRGYSADDFMLLCNLTDQLALSLENGMLFEESEQSKEDYRRLYDQSQVMNKRLIETDRLKKQFVANICHELRTPISTILGYTEVLLDRSFTGDMRVILDRVVTNSQDLFQLMDSLMNFSRLEADTMPTNLKAIDIREVAQSLGLMAERLINRRPVNFRLDIASSVGIIESDPSKLQQILMQLLTNAIKFTERGEIALKVQMVSTECGAFVEIVVSDTGVGIDKQNQEIIFEEFRQLDGSSTRHYGGMGVGLSLCKRLAESLGGKIQVESEVGKGSSFSLLLPIAIPQLTKAA
ncbi:MAG: GAF domain-containing sensor histidine kinase [Deltaproteobacteria bacterium]|nr:MAG: GAF domain-containing sensor histidine kinase [Deltaproteobacteria bacterium]